MFILLDVFHFIYFISPDVFAYFTVLGDEKLLLSTDKGKILLLKPRLEVRHQLFFALGLFGLRRRKWVSLQHPGEAKDGWCFCVLGGVKGGENMG